MYKLKPNVPDFEIVDGPFAGRKYRVGETYKEVPPEESHKFIESEVARDLSRNANKSPRDR